MKLKKRTLTNEIRIMEKKYGHGMAESEMVVVYIKIMLHKNREK